MAKGQSRSYSRRYFVVLGLPSNYYFYTFYGHSTRPVFFLYWNTFQLDLCSPWSTTGLFSDNLDIRLVVVDYRIQEHLGLVLLSRSEPKASSTLRYKVAQLGLWTVSRLSQKNLNLSRNSRQTLSLGHVHTQIQNPGKI